MHGYAQGNRGNAPARQASSASRGRRPTGRTSSSPSYVIESEPSATTEDRRGNASLGDNLGVAGVSLLLAGVVGILVFGVTFAWWLPEANIAPEWQAGIASLAVLAATVPFALLGVLLARRQR